MPNEQQRVRLDTAHIHHAIGLFVASFEQYCERMRWVYRILFKRRGLVDYDMGNIFLYHRIFTAHPLAECLWFTFRHLYKSHDSIIKEADDIYKTFSRIVEERNDIVHGQLVYYSSIEVDNLDANYISRLLAEVGDKRKVHKDGMAVKKLPDVNRLAHLIRELRMLDKRLGDLVFATRPLTMERPGFLGTRQDP